MKKFLVVLTVVIVLFLVYKYFFKKTEPSNEKPQPVAVSKHSTLFNESMAAIMTNYYNMTNGFVNWDTEAVHTNAAILQQSINNFRVNDLKKDSTIYQTVLFPLENAKTNIADILAVPTWLEKRRAFQDLSNNLRMILLTVKYDQAVSYWQECPMAFGEGQLGNWLSPTKAIVNPYLGNKDPKYGNTMVQCGETKTILNFTDILPKEK